MMTVIVPDNVKVVQVENIRSFSPQDKIQYFDKVILEVLRANPEGLTAPEIKDALRFYHATVRQHLARLVERGQAISHHRGKLTLYYPNGDLVGKPYVIESKTKDGLQYVVNKLKTRDGLSYYIQQKELDAYRSLRVKGGITISKDDAEDFIKLIHTFVLKEHNNG